MVGMVRVCLKCEEHCASEFMGEFICKECLEKERVDNFSKIEGMSKRVGELKDLIVSCADAVYHVAVLAYVDELIVLSAKREKLLNDDGDFGEDV